MFCTNCGQENKDEAKFCTNCGQSLIKFEDTLKFEKIKEDFNVDDEKGKNEKNVYKTTSIILACIIMFVVIGFGTYITVIKNIQQSEEVSVSENATNNSKKESKPLEKKEEDTKKEIVNKDYIIENSNSAYLTKEDLKTLSKKQLSYARNEIFARHGYAFKSQEYQEYFSSKKWYSIDESYDGNQNVLNEYEKANLKLIESLEKAM